MPYWFDGNNLIGQSAAQARSDRATRRAFLATLSGFARTRGGSFIVFFDGDDPDRSLPPPSVQIRYSAPLSTDDMMIKKLAEAATPSEVIVVTNDISLQGKSILSGAKTMGWDQFLTRMRPRTVTRHPGMTKEESVDLDEWSRYFGLDKDSLD